MTRNACNACQQAHKKGSVVVQPFQPHGQGSSRRRHPCEGSSVVDHDERIPKREWMPGPQTGRREQFQIISPMPSSINLSTHLQGHHLMVTSFLDWSKVIIWPMKDGNGKRTFELGQIVNLSCHPWDSNVKVSSYFSSLSHFSSHNHNNYFSLPIEQNPPNPPQQDTSIPCVPCKQTLRQPTAGPSGTCWSEDLFREPSQHNEPPIPGPGQPPEPQ
ncbi:hypothetical protein O181_017582 [Austropuccinia psidii MF-1]|uniref:Uncharacterized protein n=1 Tax=Austropuccinia psidii MF-1 TaxID=1389203 RepID=A0A9Q3GSP9_9BASI|nr:hypothetical protein [Austropuccinia psidii MF-1]